MADSIRDVGLLLGVFVGATAIAEAFGAANMGTAMSFGVLAFAAVLLWVLLRR
ncbi:MAG TPA: hypothetical protein VHJ54_09910 [Solirubrobacterales bacterium]|nr:hypothetical protein [Solirubrobacterales bacterium]